MCYKCEFFAFCMNANLDISCQEIKENIRNFAGVVDSLKKYLMANHVSMIRAKKILKEPQIVPCKTGLDDTSKDIEDYVMAEKKIACQWCGKMFLPVAKDSKYCSVGCYREAKKHKKKTFKRTCGCCGETFETTYYSKYCSQSCRNKMRQKREIRTCQQCGKKFSAIKSKQQKFCSEECFRAYQKTKIGSVGNFIGEIGNILCKL